MSRVLLSFLAAGSLLAQGPPRSLKAERTSEAPRIDGRLDEVAWGKAQSATGFRASWPELGATPAQATDVKVLYDDHYVYVGARMHHQGGRAQVVREVHRRDQDSASDWFGVYLDSLHDRRTAFAFMVNAAGVQQDRVCFGDTNQDTSWDGVWESAVQVDAGGWTAELKIPLSLLRLKDGGGSQAWGINFYRHDYLAKEEISYWEVVPRGANAFVSLFPELTGIEGVKPQPRREWIPYLSTQRKFETAQGFDDRTWKNRVGLDAHFGITSYSQLDLTLRPDFGQVEVDQAVLNLTTYETFFQEKRPFFLEGMEIFQTDALQPFYSRRIGQGLGWTPWVEPGEVLVDAPMATEILGAAKYTSKFDGGLNLGVLGANVEAARATVRGIDGKDYKVEMAPMTNIGVVRATQAMDEQGSFLGGFATWLHQAGPSGREARVGVLDGSFRSQDRSRSLDFSVAQSTAGVKGLEQSGQWQQVHVGDRWQNGWAVDLNLVNISRQFNLNDLGFLPRPDLRQASLDVDRRWDKPVGILQNQQWHVAMNESRDQAGHTFDRSIQTFYRAQFKGGWAATISAAQAFEVDEDRELRTFRAPTKKYLRYEKHPWYFLTLGSPRNAWWSVNYTHLTDLYSGGPSTRHTVNQSIRPSSRLSIQLTTMFEHHDGEPRYLETQAGTPIVGLRRLSELDQSLRVAYAFSPTLTCQFFTQWVDATWKYRDLKAWRDGRLQAGAQPSDPGVMASSLRLWNGNLITRWEFRPGSALYVVYTHGVATDTLLNDRASLSPWRDMTQLQHLPSDDVVQVKLSWLFR